MPKLKPTPAQKRCELLKAWQRYCGIDNETAGACIGVSPSTYSRRMRDGKFEVDQLIRLVDVFHVPPEDALTILTGGCRSLERRK